jgi:cardiolipin synthase A/B
MPSTPRPLSLPHLPDGWHLVPVARFEGGNQVQLLQGGDELFPAMCTAIARAQREVWLATYIFQDDDAGRMVADALVQAAQRGVTVRVVIDGYGSGDTLERVREWLVHPNLHLVVHRPLRRWWSFLQPEQLRRLHQKLCVVDAQTAFVGGINILNDRLDQTHGWSDNPRLDFAVQLQGPTAQAVVHTVRAMWTRAHLGAGWRGEAQALARSPRPLRRALGLLTDLRLRPNTVVPREQVPPVPVAFVVRDNITQRRAIERFYVDAIRQSHHQVDIICPYFYPGTHFLRALSAAAGRGVKVRLLLQGKVDYRFAALAARVLYNDLLGRGVRIFEYTPAFLHAKVAVIDGHWATVGSSNIDPLSLLLNLEANAFIHDERFAQALRSRFEAATEVSREITVPPLPRGLRGWLTRTAVYFGARLYLRLAGVNARY